jgi:hypothetical protein
LKKISIIAVSSIIGFGVSAAFYRFVSRRKPSRLERQGAQTKVEFEFGETQEAEHFFDRNPKFVPTFLRLMELANKYLSNRPLPKNQTEDICFGLGHACRRDFLEVIFLAVNGYGSGASKIIRGLYERSVALAYMVQDPDKVDRFVRYAAVQEHRILDGALKVVNEADFDAIMGPANSVSEIRRRYREVKPEFEMDVCRECGTRRVQPSWDLDVPAMVHKVQGLYQQFFLPNYVVPNLAIHATLSSATLKNSPSDEHREADLQVLCASLLLLLTLRSQESIFHLGFEKEIEACEEDIQRLRPQQN